MNLKLKTILYYIFRVIITACFLPFILLIAFYGWLERDKSGDVETNDKAFNFETFKALSLPHKHKYSSLFLKIIGEGVSRTVYRFDNDKVLKIVFKHTYQNKSEAYLFNNPLKTFTKVYDVGENYEWILCQYAKDATKDDFSRLVNVDFEKIEAWLLRKSGRYFVMKFFKKKRYSNKELDEINDIPLFDDIKSLRRNAFLDLSKISSWGIVVENGEERLVIRDSGLVFK